MITVKRKMKLCLFECTCMYWSCWSRWRGWCKPAVAVSYLVILGTVLPLLIYHINAQTHHGKVAAWFVAGLAVLLTLPVFLAGLTQHILNYTQPHLQKHIIRILWIVPIYSLNSWMALTFQKSAVYLDTIRECYEAYVLYNFLCYLCNFLTSEYNLIAELEARPAVTHIFPCCCLPPWPKGASFVRRCRIGVLQYIVVRVLITVIALISQLSNVYFKGVLKANNAWVYLGVMNGISQAIALTCLITFYKGTRELLKPIHPIGKFLSIKAIVFAMFWQALLITILVKSKTIPDSWEDYDLQEGLQNFIVILEMFLFAVAHYFVFSHQPYIDPAAAEVPCISTCFRMLDVRDVADDVREHFVDPLPRPSFRRGRNTTSIGETTERRDNSAEDSPLLRKKSGSYSTDGSVGNSSDFLVSDDRGKDLSFDVLSYSELDARRHTYGQRATMIANAGEKQMIDKLSEASASNELQIQ